MSIDYDILNEVQGASIELQIYKKFNTDISDSLRYMFSKITSFYKKHPPESINNDLYFIIDDNSLQDKLSNDPKIVSDSNIDQYLGVGLIILLHPSGQAKIWFLDECDINLKDELDSVIYHYGEDKFETMWFKGEEIILKNPESDSRSIFSSPTFKSLDSALINYSKKAEYCNCKYLLDCFNDEGLLYLKPKPEHKMRDSLYHFLHDTLRAVEVKREQNVDESKPVDIKVTWKQSNARALIEVKWLGKSFDSDGNITSDYSGYRARDGAKQLKDYIELSCQENYCLHHEGFLVVFDCRRRGLSNFEPIEQDEALYYVDREIDYSADICNIDFMNVGYRFFIKPSCA